MTNHPFQGLLAALLVAMAYAGMEGVGWPGGGAGVTLAEMMKGARKLVSVCANVKAGESVLIVTDARMTAIAQAIAAATRECGAEPVIAIIDQRALDSAEPPKAVAEAMKASDVIFSAVSISITHTRAANDAIAAGSRMIALSAFTEEMLVSGGIDADFAQVRVACKAVGGRMAAARIAHVTSREGTDLTFSMEGRRINVMPGIVERGELSPVPNAEVNVSPIEGSANGVIVIDASIPYLGIGLLKKPIRLTVRNGFIVAIDGGDPEQAGRLKEAWERQQDPNVYNIAEMGIGMNPKCRFIGVMLEDEGVLGSIHIGTGTSITLGGTVKARSHYDLIMRKPTLSLDGEVLIDQGKLKH
jgi:leucyl aminopeptidase (aminopeptidase T)